MKKKIIALTLICVGLIGTTAFANSIRSNGISVSSGYDYYGNVSHGGSAYTYTYYDKAEAWLTAYNSSNKQIDYRYASGWTSAVTDDVYNRDIARLKGEHRGYDGEYLVSNYQF
ncbi:hypothetical protein [Clostridium sp. C8-1-8]|uniref:hypothetical protein n=1 Tax=Clostridium sp. C8-1-8 TaxID=2698831 RepID=UPI001367AE81|nr:hypothetical protein [Clostridium sp. C8-1-8]